MSKTIQTAGLVLACLWLVFPVAGRAAEVGNLYQAEVLVYGQRSAERAQVMGDALAEVLVKVSGRGNTPTVEGIRAALANATRYLQSYQYRDLTETQRQALEARLEEGQRDRLKQAQMVSFRFDKSAVDKLLQANDIPIWGATRPSTLVWLAIQQDDRRYLLSSEDGDTLREVLRSAAKQRGLALLLPLMDLQDQAGLRFADVWGGFPEPVLAASRRYQTDSVLMGRLYQGFGNKWRGQWTLIEGGRSQSWSVEAEQQQEVLAQGVGGAAEILAGVYAPVLSQQQEGLIPVVVTAIHNATDYSRVMGYLQSLQEVSRVVVEEINPDRVFFQVDIKGTAIGLAKTIGLGEVLVPDTETSIPGPQGTTPADTGFDSIFSSGGISASPRPQVYRLLP